MREQIPKRRLLVRVRLDEADLLFAIEQRRDDAHRARRVEHVHRRLAVTRRDLHRGVLAARRRAADEERKVEVLALHLLGDEAHLLERRGDETGEADDVDVLLLRGLQDRLARNHHAEIDHLVAVAREDHADDVFPDVVHVAFDGGEQDLPVFLLRAVLLLLHERLEVRDGALHHARALHDLRQKHFPAPKRSPTIFMPSMSGPSITLSGLPYSLRASSASCSMNSTMPATSACSIRFGTSFSRHVEIELFLFSRALHALGELDHSLGRVGAAIEQDVFDVLEELFGDVFVHAELTGVDDAHVEARLDRVIEERRVDGFAHEVVAAKREREIRDAAGDVHVRARLFDDARGLDEIFREGVVLFDSRRDREDVRIEDDVLGRRARRPR